MGRARKDFRSLNIRLDRSIHDQLEVYCEQSGQSKTTAVERAILMYIQSYQNNNSGGKAANG